MTEPRSMEYMGVDDLVGRFHPQNPKTHDIDELRRSMGRFGFTESIMLDERTGRLAAGHGRVEVLAADEAEGVLAPEEIISVKGKWQVPVQRGWSSKDDAEALAYLVASNRISEIGGWSDDLVTLLQAINDTDQAFTGIGYGADDLEDLLYLGQMADMREVMSPDEREAGYLAAGLRYLTLPLPRDDHARVVAWLDRVMEETGAESHAAAVYTVLENYQWTS